MNRYILNRTALLLLLAFGFSISVSADGNIDFTMVPAFFPLAPPTINSFSPSSGPAGTLVTINGTGLNNPTGFIIGGVSAIAISDDGTTLVGMVMTGAATGAVSVTTTSGTGIAFGNFTVTQTPYPSTQQGPKLVGTGAAVTDVQQGWSVSVSADGNTALVGGEGDNGGAGAAWVFARSGGVWTQQGAKLVGTGAAGVAQQGWSVSISADGNTALVGGINDSSFTGAAWVFIRSGGVWTQQGTKLVGTGAVGNAGQGISVSLSADGNTALVGGCYDNSNDGAVWVYSRSGGVWTQQGTKLVGTGATGPTPARQGCSISVSADGNTALLGGYYDGNDNTGAAWVFTRSGGVWTQQGVKLVGTGAEGPYASSQGWSVSLSADGNTALVGGYSDNNYTGATWVFIRSGEVWAQQGTKLVGAGASGNAAQGQSVSLSADGNTALVGGDIDNNGNYAPGATWVFTRSVGVWAQQGAKLVGTGAAGYAQQGTSVSLSADGTTALVGGPFDGISSYDGAAWVFIPSSGPLPVTFINVKARRQENFIAVDWQVANQLNIAKYEVQKSTDGLNFSKVGTQNVTGFNGSNAAYTWLDEHAVAGDNFYRIRSINEDGNIEVSQVVKFSIGRGMKGITIYPNPVINNTITVEFSNMDKGIYMLKIFNAAGQFRSTQRLIHPGGNSVQTVALGHKTAAGSYHLEIIDRGGNKTFKSVVIAN